MQSSSLELLRRRPFSHAFECKYKDFFQDFQIFLLLSAALGRYRLGLLRCWLGCERVDDGGGTEDADIGQGAVVLVGSHLLNLIDDIEALQDFTKDSILKQVPGTCFMTISEPPQQFPP